MTTETERAENTDERRSKPPIFVKMADEGNVPGRPSSKTLFFIIAVMLIGVVAIYFANHTGSSPL